MRILILNWRDLKNPAAGGAEILTHELARGWVRAGHQVTIFTSIFTNSKPTEIIDRVKIVRRGRWWTVHFWALVYYLFDLHQKVDVVVDEVHWFPFFSVVYAQRKTILLVCEVASPLFKQLFPYWIGLLGRLIEELYFKLYCHRIPVLTISKSTKLALMKHGFQGASITVLPMGITRPLVIKQKKRELRPTLVFLGRMHKLKGVEDFLEIVRLVKLQLSECQAWMIGSGEPAYLEFLKERARQMLLKTTVKFYGFTSDQQKFTLLSRAHLLIVPSCQEGWGLVVAEANFVGTPVVAYNVLGLHEVVKSGVNGLLVDPNPIQAARAALDILSNSRRYQILQDGAKREAAKYDWGDAVRESLNVFRTNHEV